MICPWDREADTYQEEEDVLQGRVSVGKHYANSRTTEPVANEIGIHLSGTGTNEFFTLYIKYCGWNEPLEGEVSVI